MRCVDLIKIDGARWVLGMTDYGEIILCNDAGELRYFTVENVPFRSMAMLSNNRMAAMTSDGMVVVLEFSGARIPQMKVEGTIRLGTGVWKDVCFIGKDMLVATSNKSLTWINTRLMAIKDIVSLESGLHALGFEEETGMLHIFGTNGLHYVVSASNSNKCKRSDIKGVKELVTAFFHNKQNGTNILGTETGVIYVTDKNGHIISTMTGHTGAITSIKAVNNSIVSTSYDHTMRFWSFAGMASIAESIEFQFDSWPLSFVVDDESQMIWIGNEAGGMNRFCTSVNKNAIATQALLRREFTQDEWNYYIGKSVPYRTFMKGGGK